MRKTVDVFSSTTVPLEMIFNSNILSIGTGFIWEARNIFYLITNWHNCSGRDSITGENLSKEGGWPNRVKVHLNVKENLGPKFSEIFDLYDKNGKPNWLIHRKLGHAIDVVALALRPTTEPDWYAMNQQQQLDLSLSVGQDVFILGYPFGIGVFGFPIWKRGSIASEPEIFTADQQYILVDTASRPGMSGSPVVRRSWGNHTLSNGSLLGTVGSATRFIGIYSGRLKTADQTDAQLGLVWPAFFIDEIIMDDYRDPSTQCP